MSSTISFSVNATFGLPFGATINGSNTVDFGVGFVFEHEPSELTGIAGVIDDQLLPDAVGVFVDIGAAPPVESIGMAAAFSNRLGYTSESIEEFFDGTSTSAGFTLGGLSAGAIFDENGQPVGGYVGTGFGLAFDVAETTTFGLAVTDDRISLFGEDGEAWGVSTSDMLNDFFSGVEEVATDFFGGFSSLFSNEDTEQQVPDDQGIGDAGDTGGNDGAGGDGGDDGYGGGSENNIGIDRDDPNFGGDSYSGGNDFDADGRPIILDLDGDGSIDIAPANRSTFFDLDGDGFLERTGWAGADDGFLVLDLSSDGGAGADGKIDQAREIGFALWTEADDTDLQAFGSLFDANGDGDFTIDDFSGPAGSDSITVEGQTYLWTDFRVWQDRDQDGEVDHDTGELRTLDGRNVRADGQIDDTDYDADAKVISRIWSAPTEVVHPLG